MRIGRLVAAILIATSTVVGVATAAPSSFAGAPRTSASITFTHAWTRSCFVCQTPIVRNGLLYTADGPPDTSGNPYSSTLRALNASSGAPVWTHPFGTVRQLRVEVVANGLVDVIEQSSSGPAHVMALDAATGHLRWTFTPASPGSGSNPYISDVVVDGPAAYVVNGVYGHWRLSKLDTTGHLQWSLTHADDAGGFAAANGSVFVFGDTFVPPGSQRDSLNVFRETDGVQLHRFTYLGSASVSFRSVVAAHGLVYATQYAFGEGTGHDTVAIDPATGAIRWQGSEKTSVVSSPKVLVGASCFVSSSGDSSLSGYDPVTGKVLWGPIGGQRYSNVGPGCSPAIGGNVVYGIEPYGPLDAIDLTTGALLGTLPPPNGEYLDGVAAAGGRIFVTTWKHIFALTPS